MGSQKVIVLWDLETSLIGETAENAVAAIRLLALSSRGGEIRKMTAYYSTRLQQVAVETNGNNQGFQDYLGELTLHGVTPKDTTFLGGTESTAKCMLVDMLLEMVDAAKQPPMLLIISDDRSLKHPVELLRNRHRVVHIKSSSEHQAAMDKVLAGETPQIPLGGGASHVPDSPMLGGSHTLGTPSVGSQPTPARVGLALPPQEVQANPNLIPIASNMPVPSIASNVHPKYRALVEVLEEARDGGSLTVEKALLGNKLAEKSKTLYRDAGVKDFKKYIATAEADGIVTVGGGGTGTWVALKGAQIPQGGGESIQPTMSAPLLGGFGYYT
ncbi:hypothetical protein BKA70DRAFT_34706 [Coprinopsis sp. MPI-PUGE-AT-0042]|nr:hypothetical protein BKA70DRAFT_34706 [Coprinopsis sp. MPI-PUGE-AT-0042]